MRRSTVVVVAVSAVVGLGGGALAAVVLEDAGPDESSATAPDQAADRTADVLYLSGRTLRDGDEEVRLQRPLRDPVRLVRLASGWLVADRTGEGTSLLWRVDPAGAAYDVAEVRDGWDLDRTRTKVAGVYAGDGVLTAWSLALAGHAYVLGRADGVPEVAAVGWQGDRVLATETLDPNPGRTWTWRPGTRPRGTPEVLPDDLDASRDGDLVAGAVTEEGFTVGNAPNRCLLVTAAPGAEPRADGTLPSVQTCDWRPDVQAALFSPSARLVLAIPSATDGFGPGSFGTFSATGGPSEDLAVLDAPDWTVGAQWLDDDTLLVLSRTSGDSDAGSRLQACTRDGSRCEPVASSRRSTIVVGEPY